MRKNLLADLPTWHVVRLQLRQRHPDECDLTPQDLHGGAVIRGPGDGRLRHEVVRLSEALHLAEDLGKTAGSILDVQVLMQGVPLATDRDRLTLADAIDPRKLPGDLPQHPLYGAIGRRGFENGDREAVVRKGLQQGRICGCLVLTIGGEGTQRVVFGHRQPLIRDPVGADGRALHDMGDVTIGTHTTEGIGPGETEHIDHRVEALGLECTLERGPRAPVAPHEAGPRGDLAPQAAIETGDLMALCQQDVHDTRTDMTRSPDDTDAHPLAPPSTEGSTLCRVCKRAEDRQTPSAADASRTLPIPQRTRWPRAHAVPRIVWPRLTC